MGKRSKTNYRGREELCVLNYFLQAVTYVCYDRTQYFRPDAILQKKS